MKHSSGIVLVQGRSLC